MDRLEQPVDLDLLFLDVERDLLEIEEPIARVGVAGLSSRLELLS